MELEIERRRTCPTCAQSARIRRFDVVVHRPGARDRDYFGLLAMCCRVCGRFVLDRETAALLGIADEDVAGAIQSDLYMRPVGGALR